MRQARARLAALVQERKDIAGLRPSSPAPGVRDQVELPVLQLGNGAHVPPAVDDDLLSGECRVEIWNDAHAPIALLRQDERLRRGHVLMTCAEWARRELLRRRRIELRA